MRRRYRPRNFDSRKYRFLWSNDAGGGFSPGSGGPGDTTGRTIACFAFGASAVSRQDDSTSSSTVSSSIVFPGDIISASNKVQAVEQAISLKVVIEKKNKKVLFAECNKDFIDVIFGFLTLPIGRIVRLLEGILPPAAIGCLNNIYGSVGNLDIHHFKTEACKQMLLHPGISSKVYFRNLKLKIDGEKAKCFYFCRNPLCRKEGKARLSEFPHFHCRCGQVMDQMATLVEPVENAFVREGTEVFLLGDDMQIMPGMSSLSMSLLKQFGIREVNELEIRHGDVGNKEILKLLWLILVSKTPLTNWIFEDSISSLLGEIEMQNIIMPAKERCDTRILPKMSLTLIFCKSMNKVLYAECTEEFVDFLFSFLTFPLGSVLQVLDGKSQVGCLDNIYKSIGDLSTNGYFKSEEAKNMLLCPTLSPHVGYKNNPLQIEETVHPQYLLFCRGRLKSEWFVYPVHSASSDIILGESTTLVSNVVNPKSSDGEATCNGGFIKGPATFMISDELVVSLLSPASSISFIGKSNVAISDIDEISLEVGEEEAKNLLRAALLSRTALTDVFSRTCLDMLESKDLGEDLETLKF